MLCRLEINCDRHAGVAKIPQHAVVWTFALPEKDGSNCRFGLIRDMGPSEQASQDGNTASLKRFILQFLTLR